jgi:hypothetical protein
MTFAATQPSRGPVAPHRAAPSRSSNQLRTQRHARARRRGVRASASQTPNRKTSVRALPANSGSPIPPVCAPHGGAQAVGLGCGVEHRNPPVTVLRHVQRDRPAVALDVEADRAVTPPVAAVRPTARDHLVPSELPPPGRRAPATSARSSSPRHGRRRRRWALCCPHPRRSAARTLRRRAERAAGLPRCVDRIKTLAHD